MKIYHFTILFVIFALAFVIIKESELKEQAYNAGNYFLYKKSIEKATEAAAWELRSAGVNFTDATGESAIDAFFYSLYASMGIMDNASEKDKIRDDFLSFTVFIDRGYYIYREAWEDGAIGKGRVYINSGLLPYDEDTEGRTGFLCNLATPIFDGKEEKMISSAYVSDGDIFIIDKDNVYHAEGCIYIGDVKCTAFSKEGCAMLGARPCKKCMDQ